LELEHYIQSGIIESYVLGLATPEELAELQYMRRLYPALNTEIAAVERRIEITAMDEAVMPPAQLKNRLFQRINWPEEFHEPIADDASKNYTFINIQPKDQNYITVHKAWRYFFAFVFVFSKVCLFFAIYYYLKYQQVMENRQIPAPQYQHVQAAGK
jgi:hypothetical protein